MPTRALSAPTKPLLLDGTQNALLQGRKVSVERKEQGEMTLYLEQYLDSLQGLPSDLKRNLRQPPFPLPVSRSTLGLAVP